MKKKNGLNLKKANRLIGLKEINMILRIKEIGDGFTVNILYSGYIQSVQNNLSMMHWKWFHL